MMLNDKKYMLIGMKKYKGIYFFRQSAAIHSMPSVKRHSFCLHRVYSLIE